LLTAVVIREGDCNSHESTTHRSTNEHHPLDQYEICIKGHLDQRWSDWFEGFAIALKDNGETRLSGPVVDQAALYGLLIKVRDLGLPLVSVVLTKPDKQNIQIFKTGE
jgi:hypothetical protein